jgi:hypothetical protein
MFPAGSQVFKPDNAVIGDTQDRIGRDLDVAGDHRINLDVVRAGVDAQDLADFQAPETHFGADSQAFDAFERSAQFIALPDQKYLRLPDNDHGDQNQPDHSYYPDFDGGGHFILSPR